MSIVNNHHTQDINTTVLLESSQLTHGVTAPFVYEAGDDSTDLLANLALQNEILKGENQMINEFEQSLVELMDMFVDSYAEGRTALPGEEPVFMYKGDRKGFITYTTDTDFVKEMDDTYTNLYIESMIRQAADEVCCTEVVEALETNRDELLLLFYGLHEVGHAVHADEHSVEDWVKGHHDQVKRMDKTEERLKKIAGDDMDLYNQMWAKSYRMAPRESYADRFAATSIVKHWSLIGLYI